MGRKLPPREAELYKRCDEVLHYIWDPIGIAGAPGARREYYAYLPSIFARVRDEVDADQIVEDLIMIEEQRMTLIGNRENARPAVDVLMKWREWIWEFIDE